MPLTRELPWVGGAHAHKLEQVVGGGDDKFQQRDLQYRDGIKSGPKVE